MTRLFTQNRASFNNMPVARNDAGRGTFKVPLLLDLSGVTNVKKAALPNSLRRTLSNINTDKQPSDNLGFFSRTEEDQRNCYAMMDHLLHSLKTSHSGYDGLHAMEEDNAKKIVNASGFRRMAYFLTDSYPWIVSTDHAAFPDDAAPLFRDLITAVLNSDSVGRVWLHSASPAVYADAGTKLWYKKGASYGVYPYVQGSSKLNPVALAWHISTGLAFSQVMGTKSGNDDAVLRTFRDVVGTCSTEPPYITEVEAHMMIRRARPLSSSKLVPIWEVNRKDRTLKALTYEHGYSAGSREIKPVSAALNTPFIGVAQAMSYFFHRVPGLDVGHQITSCSLLRSAIDLWGAQHVRSFAVDIKGFDNSVSVRHTATVKAILIQVFNLPSWMEGYLDLIDVLPIVTTGLFDDRDSYTLMKREGGVPSGFIGTTLYGSLINLITQVCSIAKSRGQTLAQTINECLNFCSITGTPPRSAKWGILLKGDDSDLFWRDDYLNPTDVNGIMADLGFATDVEPHDIFLMQYIDKRVMRVGADYPYCPPAFRNVMTLTSFGLAAKRVGNRQIMVEHPIKEVAIARLALMSNLADMTFHPCYSDYRDYLLGIMNKYDDAKPHGGWTESTLYKYLLSDKGKAELTEVSSSKATSSAYLKELSRKIIDPSLMNDQGVNAPASTSLFMEASLKALKGVTDLVVGQTLMQSIMNETTSSDADTSTSDDDEASNGPHVAATLSRTMRVTDLTNLSKELYNLIKTTYETKERRSLFEE